MSERRICIVLGGFLASLNPAVLHRTAVVSLLNARGPAAILRRVRAGVVDAVNAVSLGRLRSHVGNESGEIMDPFIAHGDAASAPVGIARMRLFEATLFSLAPSVVFGAVTAAWFVAVLGGAFSGALVLVTAATVGLAVAQMLSGDLFDNATVALAQPHRVALFGAKGKHRPSRKSLAGQVNDSRIAVVHVG